MINDKVQNDYFVSTAVAPRQLQYTSASKIC